MAFTQTPPPGSKARLLTRRALLRRAGSALVAAPVLPLAFSACDPAPGATLGGDDAGASSGGDSSATADTASDWATGGTASMSGNYPDPFSAGLGAACTLSCAMTLGPCYASTLSRKDISEGHAGLPVRLAFLVVDESCAPIAGASVDIWHCAPEGLYSGDDASDFCTSGDQTARAARWFRGVQVTDDKGRVDFDTCFPGWYSGRTIHIHFTIRINDVEYVTSQLFFDDALDDEIVATQPLYDTRGSRDTTNQTDTVISAAEVASYTFQTARQADGAMLAWKALVIRSSTAESLCQAAGGSGGPGGPGPGDGGMPPPGAPPTGG